MTEWLRTKWEILRSSYWFIPSMMAIAALVLAFTIVRLDERYRDDALREQGWIYSGGAEGARAVLSTIAGSIITVAGTTFSITIAVLSLASGQFGPRLLRNFMRDTGNQVVLGTFTSTFLYCLLVLRTVRGQDDNTYVPHISVTVGVALAVLSLGVLIYFIHHVAESIQVGHVINVVAGELHRAIARIFPDRLPEPPDGVHVSVDSDHVVCAKQSGYLQSIDEGALLRAAAKSTSVVTILRRPGDYVINDMPLLAVDQPVPEDLAATFRGAFTCGQVRTPNQDAAFAFLQLAEIAVRALSPGINDPFTAMMCIDRITSGMVQLGGRSMPHLVRFDESGAVRVLAYPYSYDELVRAGYGHIRESAEGQQAVTDYLRQQLQYVLGQATVTAFQSAIRKELAALR